MVISCEPSHPENPTRVSRQGQGGGPKTSFGKQASSKNATTHGLAARYRLKDHFQENVHERLKYYVARYQPQDDDDAFLCAQAAIGYTRERHAMGEAYQFLAVRAQRAILYWDFDREGDAALLAARLSKKPAEVAPRLAASLHGARWLLGRWGHLGDYLETVGDWLEPQVALAYDLLGIDAEVRKTDPKRLAKGSKEERLAVVAEEIRKLREMTEGEYLEHDRFLRKQAILGDGYLDDPAYRRFLRYGRQGQLLNERCLKELERRRVARNLPAYEPDGRLLAPIDPPGTPPHPAPEPLPENRIAFYEPHPLTRYHLLDEAESEEANDRAESVSEAGSEPAPSPAPAAPRPRLSPEELRKKADEARLKLEAEREARRREKARAKAERKAAKTARARQR
ncbi:MAG: hypothetical protein U0800_07830 [Isosphaeraceae bacterium]